MRNLKLTDEFGDSVKLSQGGGGEAFVKTKTPSIYNSGVLLQRTEIKEMRRWLKKALKGEATP